MEKHVGVIAIIINDRKTAAPKVNEVLTKYGDLVIGRMGIPYPKRNVYVVTLIVDGSNDEIGAMTGKLGAIKDVTVKSTLTKCE
ncbi:MAG: iron-only hydrogenase system regulator [Elusimicrobiales bacterium]|nr:iron-only hydrogenase system regulator [Elusimicrobiales bacterium]